MTLNGVLTRSELMCEAKFEEFLRALQNYLREQLTPYDYLDGRPFYRCDYQGKWENFADYCDYRGYDWHEVIEMINEYSGLNIECECWVLNSVEVPDQMVLLQ